MKKWQDVCIKNVSFKEFRGDHFFLLENPVEVANFVKDQLGIENISL